MGGPLPTITGAEYQQAHAWGLSTGIDIFDCAPSIVRNRELIEVFARDLCHLVGVRRSGDPLIIRFGDDPVVCGHSMVQLIETSLVLAHFVERSNTVYLDVFSCKWYDVDVAVSLRGPASRAGVSTCKNVYGAKRIGEDVSAEAGCPGPLVRRSRKGAR